MSGSSTYLREAIHKALVEIYDFEEASEAEAEAEEIANRITRDYAVIISPQRRKAAQ